MAHISSDQKQGHRQSPIDIELSHCHHDHSLRSIQFDHAPSDCVDVINKGSTWSIRLKSDPQTRLSGAHLPGTYRLAEVHAHWGERSNDGSEHLIGNCAYAAEIHMVHYAEKYGTLEAAKGYGDGLAVLGILLEESQLDNPSLEPLLEALKQVRYKGQTAQFPHGLNLYELLPSNTTFCTYLGSLTTPPYTECVIWTVFVHPNRISRRQLEVFRSLCACDANGQNVNIVNNVRACQVIGKREIRASFQHMQQGTA